MSTLVNLQYGYDRASNRKYRRDEVSRVQSTPKYFDELYGYDGLNRLTAFARGELSVGNTTIGNPTLGQGWTLDPTGNWQGFSQTVADPLTQTRTHNVVNEIDGIGETEGDQWPTPGYDNNGNTTSFPDPRNLETGLTATYDAWNRLVKLADTAGTVAEYEYDGLNRRITKTVASTVRHYYFSDRWQVLEERVGSATSADRQYVWGLRYVDDLVLRDRTSERLYVLQDALFNVVAITDATGDVKERFAYQPYGKSEALDSDFTTYSGTDYQWEYRFTGRELDLESGLQINRNRYLHLELGRWLTRDPIGYDDGNCLYQYVKSMPLTALDPKGMKCSTWGGWLFSLNPMQEYVYEHCFWKCPLVPPSVITDQGHAAQDWANEQVFEVGGIIDEDDFALGKPGHLDSQSREHSALRHCLVSGLLASRLQSCNCAQCIVDSRDMYQYFDIGVAGNLGQNPVSTQQAIYNDLQGRLCAGCWGPTGVNDPADVAEVPQLVPVIIYYHEPASEIKECCRRKLLNGELATNDSVPPNLPILPPRPTPGQPMPPPNFQWPK